MPEPNHLISTFSIVAFDPKTKNLGVAVQSRYFSVGTAVPWAQAEVGAIATIKKAIELNPNSDDAYVDLGMTYTKRGKTQEARKAFNKATSLNPNMKTVISQLTKRNQPLE
ncbi:MAG: DUF1028 domain-containing protein [Candidatus Bathyarchaeia archaeon]